MRRGLLAVAVLVPLFACRATRPSQLPREPAWLVAVKSAQLPASGPFWKRFAHHAWVDVKRGGEDRWERIESAGRLGVVHGPLAGEEARLDQRFGGRSVRLLGWIDGEAAQRAVAKIDAASAALAAHHGDDYTVWPGPNSNTFVRELLADVPEIGFVFDPNAVGKDYSPWLGAGWTASKTGIRVDTPVLGAAVGLREGVEVHLLQLTFGLSLDPPGLSLPFLPQLPFGWFAAAPAELRPPERPWALRVDLAAAVLDGERRDLGEIGLPAAFVVARPDGLAWLQIDAAIGPALPGLRARDLSCEVVHHDQDGVWQHTHELRLDPQSREPSALRVQCGDAVVAFDLALQPSGALRVGARCFRDLAHEAASRR